MQNYILNYSNHKNIILPKEGRNEFNTYHTFVIQAKNRDKLKEYLEKKGISTSIHYPKLIFQQKAYKKKFNPPKRNDLLVAKKLVKNILTLPVNQFLRSNEIYRISNEINKFYN